MSAQRASLTTRLWIIGLSLVSVVALVVIAVGLLLPRPQPELTTIPVSSSEESAPAISEPPETVDEPFDPTAPIPGCDVVKPPGKGFMTAVTSQGEPSYDNPKFPWFTGPKATAMSDAVAELLPPGAEIEFASPELSLIFQPITDFSEATPNPPNGSTNAHATVINGSAEGGVYVTVQQTSEPVPLCIAGSVDERRTLADGVIVDVQDTWHEVDGVRTLSRSASAYVADGSRISAGANDVHGATQQEHSGAVPLTIDDLVRIVADPRLRVSTPVAPGTPAPPAPCGSPFGQSDGPPVTREEARKLDVVLATVDLDGATLPPLQLAKWSKGTLCTSIAKLRDDADLNVLIEGGQPLPVEERPVPGSGGSKSMRTLPGGIVVQTESAFTGGPAGGNPDDTTTRATNSVVVTRPDGTQITASSTAPTPDEALPLSELESIAMTPGLEL